MSNSTSNRDAAARTIASQSRERAYQQEKRRETLQSGGRPSSARKRRLLYVGVFDPHIPLSGTGQRARNLLRGISRRFNVDAAYIEGSGRPPIPEIAERFADELPLIGRKVTVPFGSFRYYYYHPGLHRAAVGLAESAEYDAVLCDYGVAAAYGLTLHRRFKLPFVYLSHNVEHRLHLMKAKSDPRRLALLPWMYTVERAGVQRSDLLVAISDEEADFYERWKAREQIVVVPQGFDALMFNPFYQQPIRQRKVVLFCGNFGIQFNREAVRAFMKTAVDGILERHPDTEFRFVGAYPPTDIRHPAVTFTGFVDDYAAELRSADLFVTPVLAGMGSPTKVYEALASGKQVVATPMGARSVPTDYRSLHVTALEDFPAVVNRLLDERPGPETADFGRIRDEHSWRALAERLGNAIEATIEGALRR
jgi:glycosyltransferase involved in cell wall biosynthesis